jgi:hypothetical protein
MYIPHGIVAEVEVTALVAAVQGLEVAFHICWHRDARFL